MVTIASFFFFFFSFLTTRPPNSFSSHVHPKQPVSMMPACLSSPPPPLLTFTHSSLSLSLLCSRERRPHFFFSSFLPFLLSLSFTFFRLSSPLLHLPLLLPTVHGCVRWSLTLGSVAKTKTEIKTGQQRV